MRIAIHARIEGEDGQVQSSVEIGAVERDSQDAPSSGLGLFLRDTHSILQKLQDVVLQEQVARFVQDAAMCRGCGHRLGFCRDKRRYPRLLRCMKSTTPLEWFLSSVKCSSGCTTRWR